MEALLTILIPILMTVESSNNPKAIGDNGKAVGILQIHKIYVRDVNRIIGRPDHYKAKDRLNKAKSIEMTKIYLKHYCKDKIKGLSTVDALVLMGRVHNAGPRGYKKKCSLKYGAKVKILFYALP